MTANGGAGGQATAGGLGGTATGGDTNVTGNDGDSLATGGAPAGNAAPLSGQGGDGILFDGLGASGSGLRGEIEFYYT